VELLGGVYQGGETALDMASRAVRKEEEEEEGRGVGRGSPARAEDHPPRFVEAKETKRNAGRKMHY